MKKTKRTSSSLKLRSEVHSNNYLKSSSQKKGTPLPAIDILKLEMKRFHPEESSQFQIRFTNNSSTLASKSYKSGRVSLRVQKIFKEAPPEILALLVSFLFLPKNTNDSRAAKKALLDFVANCPRSPRLRTKSRPPQDPEGAYYHLEMLRDELLSIHFPEMKDPPTIGWTSKIQKRVMGKWLETPKGETNWIFINRLLDRLDVPELYVRYVVYHELLHEVFPTYREGGRWIRHSPEFREKERQFPQLEIARKWEIEHLNAVYLAATKKN